MPKPMLQTYDGFPTRSTEIRNDKFTSRCTVSNIAKKRNPMSHTHHNAVDLRAVDLSSPQSHHFSSIYVLPYSRNHENSKRKSTGTVKTLEGNMRLDALYNDEKIKVIDQLELTPGLPKKRAKYESTGKSLIHSKKKNSLVASSCLNRVQKMPVKIQVNLNNNIFPVNIDTFSRTVGEL
jgi:hypothetical protein